MMTIGEWLTFGGIVLGIISTFAIPAAVWMTKMWTSQKVLAMRVRGLGGRMRRLEDTRSNAIAALVDQQSTANDRVNEHAEHIADHGARLLAAESEVKTLRMNQHAANSAIQALQK